MPAYLDCVLKGGNSLQKAGDAGAESRHFSTRGNGQPSLPDFGTARTVGRGYQTENFGVLCQMIKTRYIRK